VSAVSGFSPFSPLRLVADAFEQCIARFHVLAEVAGQILGRESFVVVRAQ
jgi:hypothetical protein